MKPCVENQKRIALLAVNALESSEARELRAHLEVCSGCRQYHQEIARVTTALNASAPSAETEVSEAFHRRVANAVRAQKTTSAWEETVDLLTGRVWNWRVALSGCAAVALGFALLSHFQQPTPVQIAKVTIAPTVTVADTEIDLEPSIRNYQIAANRSFEKLDELLTKQARQNPSFAPAYTASSLALANGSE